jgi:molybdopterin converting factor small subunit
MMTINILAFGVAKVILGSAKVSLQPSEKITVEALKVRLEEQYPKLKQLTSFMIAVNSEYAMPGQVINGNDEIAIIPPVSGG